MDNELTMGQKQDMLNEAWERALDTLAATQRGGEMIYDPADFISRQIQQFFMDLEKSEKATEH